MMANILKMMGTSPDAAASDASAAAAMPVATPVASKPVASKPVASKPVASKPSGSLLSEKDMEAMVLAGYTKRSHQKTLVNVFSLLGIVGDDEDEDDEDEDEDEDEDDEDDPDAVLALWLSRRKESAKRVIRADPVVDCDTILPAGSIVKGLATSNPDEYDMKELEAAVKRVREKMEQLVALDAVCEG